MCDVCVVEGEINFWPGFSVVSFFFFLFVNGIFTKEGNIYLLLGTFLSCKFFSGKIVGSCTLVRGDLSFDKEGGG